MPRQLINYLCRPTGPLRGEIRVPGDKSISHRAIIMGAVADGETRVRGLLEGADVVATMDVFRAMGVSIEKSGDRTLVHGVGLRGLEAPQSPLDFGNSGTSVRLLAGLLAGQPFDTILIGDESLMQRPMGRVVDPLRLMGADIDCSASGTLPVTIRGGRRLKALDYTLPVASAQLKSCLLLAGLYADGATRITEPAPTRDHTERMLSAFGIDVRRDGEAVALRPGPLSGADVEVPGDISSAAFFLVAASIVPGSDLLLRDVGMNPTRNAVIDILRLMGADIDTRSAPPGGAEPMADIRVRHSPLTGVDIPPALVPVAIDEFPVLMIAAAAARGRTVLTNAAELRVKESDRIEAVAEGLERIGIGVVTKADGMTVTGGAAGGGEISSHGDHRIAMAFAVAAASAAGPVRILDCINVNTSFPQFVETARAAGMNIEIETADG